MPQLLTLPYAVPLSALGAILPGAKLSFFQTGSSTPQPVYTDIALSVAHSQPVVADGAGRFPAIYLEPSLPSYRILLTDSADVTQPGFPIDDVPSNQNTAQQFRLKATAPSLTFEETDASADNKIWRLKVNGEQMQLSILNDAEAVETIIFTFGRTGTTPGAVDFDTDGYLTVAGLPVATQSSGTVGITLTGMSGATTGTLTWRKIGARTILSTNTAIVGTSNATAMTLTGLGSLVTIGTNKVQSTILVDNGANTLAHAVLDGSGTITFGVGVAGGNFTAGGTKGLPAGWEFQF